MKISLWQKTKKAISNATKEVKTIITTKEGWIAWFVANIVFSATWYVPMAIGIVFNSPEILAFGTTMFIVQWSPPPIETVFVLFLTIFFHKVLFPKKHIK
jgi:hypothetical protein